jgi:uncharacterized protein
VSEADPRVRDDRVDQRFVVKADGGTAELVYTADGKQLILHHTEVPEALGGRGIGGLLVQAAIARARAEHLAIVPDCPFARGWLAKHPDAAADIDILKPTRP